MTSMDTPHNGYEIAKAHSETTALDYLCTCYNGLVDLEELGHDSKVKPSLLGAALYPAYGVTTTVVSLEDFVNKLVNIYYGIVDLLRRTEYKIAAFWAYITARQRTRDHKWKAVTLEERESGIMESTHLKSMPLTDEDVRKYNNTTLTSHIRYVTNGLGYDFKNMEAAASIARKAAGLENLNKAMMSYVAEMPSLVDMLDKIDDMYGKGDAGYVDDREALRIKLDHHRSNVLAGIIKDFGLDATSNGHYSTPVIGAVFIVYTRDVPGKVPVLRYRVVKGEPIERVPMFSRSDVDRLRGNYSAFSKFIDLTISSVRYKLFISTCTSVAKKARQLSGTASDPAVGKMLRQVSVDISNLIVSYNTITVGLINYMDTTAAAHYRLLNIALRYASQRKSPK